MSNGSGIRCKDHEVGCRLDISILPQLIPDPVWNTDSFASQYHNAGSGIRTSIGRLDLILDYILGESDHWQVFPYILEEDHLRATSTDP